MVHLKPGVSPQDGGGEKYAMRKKVIIMGAAGRDFHNFNVYFREKEEYEVVAFTATQIPRIAKRVYPPELAGSLYPEGIPMHPESELEGLLEKYKPHLVVFSYSDVPHEYVMHRASQVLSQGPSYLLLGPKATSLKSQKPVIAVGAVRTGSGKSQTTRRVSGILKKRGKKIVVVRHPMPYGELKEQVCQRFETLEDLDRYKCTIEEREEYEPHLKNGTLVYAGVDYGEILKQAENEGEIIVWDGGNNDFPFYEPDLFIVVTDPHRAGDEILYHPGETSLRMADCVVINKIDTANPGDVEELRANIRRMNPKATVVDAASPIQVSDPSIISGRKALVVEDGPTLTHGEMGYGAGVVAARKFGASEVVDPRPFAAGSIKEVFDKYPWIGNLVPAMGYGEDQIRELEETISKTPAEVLIIATPVDLSRLLTIDKPSVLVKYELQEIGSPNLENVIQGFLG